MLIFSVFIKDICYTISNSTCFIFADDFRMFCVIGNVVDCKVLQFDIDSLHNLFLNNAMNRNVD